MVPLARRNLLADKSRFAMAVGGVAFAVVLVLVILGLYRGWSDVGRLYERLPGSLWVSQRGTSDPFHSTSFLPLSAVAAVRGVEGVTSAVPVYARHVAFTSSGSDLDAFVLAIDAPVRELARSGIAVTGPGTIDVDRVLADSAAVSKGGTLTVLGRPLRVTGIHRGGNSVFQTAFIAAADARALFALPGRVSFVLVSLEPGADPGPVAARVAAAVGGSEVHTADEFAARFARRVNSGFLAVVGVLVAIGFVVGGAVVTLTTYTSTIEKAGEFGVLKALGAGDRLLYRVVVGQGLIVSVTGSLAGIAAAVPAVTFIERGVPEFITELRWPDVLAVAGAALLAGVLSSFVPARRINRIDPASVFRA